MRWDNQQPSAAVFDRHPPHFSTGVYSLGADKMEKLFGILFIGILLVGCGGEQKTNEPTPEELDAHLTPQALP